MADAARELALSFIKGVLAQNDDEALGALQAIKAKGIDPKTIPVVGIDGIADAIAAASNKNCLAVQNAHALRSPVFAAFTGQLKPVPGKEKAPPLGKGDV